MYISTIEMKIVIGYNLRERDRGRERNRRESTERGDKASSGKKMCIMQASNFF